MSLCLLKDIGRTTSGPEINRATGEVSITYYSSTKCAADPAQNYTSTIIFTCQRGLELVSQHFDILYDKNTYTCTVTSTCFSNKAATFHIFIQGSPQMLRLQGCVYLFEWATPLVCSDATHTNASSCKLTDAQLQYTFDLSTLSGEVQVSSVHRLVVVFSFSGIFQPGYTDSGSTVKKIY